jgi:hypothetical protein
MAKATDKLMTEAERRSAIRIADSRGPASSEALKALLADDRKREEQESAGN